MGISLGMVGLGQFGSAFVDLFKSHPLVDRIAFCDREKERVEHFADDPFCAEKFASEDRYYSLDDICKAGLDALVIITQPWLHAPQCIRAMEAGMDVYSAVPVIKVPDNSEILDWCDRIIKTCEKTGQRYMLGETTYYRPQAQFCRRMAKEGKFGSYVYAEGEYFHDVDARCNLRKVYRGRMGSASGKEGAAIKKGYLDKNILSGPMHYPTHSVAGPVCVMGAHAVKATAYGYRNETGDPFFTGDAFSNEVALFKMSNGATVRIAEMRETPGHPGKDEETFRVFGTTGSFAENKWFAIDRPGADNLDMENLPAPARQELDEKEMFDPLPPEVEQAFKHSMDKEADPADLQNKDFNPEGHGGSHPYLVHEFVSAVAENRQPAVNAWEAARYMAMGVAAHESALKDGETVEVTDWGDAPS